LKYPPFSRVALITLKGRNEEKVKFFAEHLKEELEKHLKSPSAAVAAVTASLFENFSDGAPSVAAPPPPKNLFKDLILAGPAPAPLLRAETFYRYQIMLRARAMSALSRELALVIQSQTMPEDITLAVDIDPVSLS
jgi:primosomal protein N'